MNHLQLDQAKLFDFYKSLVPLCANTGKNTEPSFGNEFSFIEPTYSQKELSNYRFLCLDIGGTRSKACIKIKNSGFEAEWSEILDLDNNDLKTAAVDKGLELMSLQLASRVRQALDSKNIQAEFDGLAIVWSNKIQSFKLSGSVSGIGAKVYGSKDGLAYRKGEWWNTDIEDGDDISSYFISGLKSADIKFKSLVISNDTVFTAKALKSADAGVVASTGANTTIIAKSDKQFYNSECGGKILISKELLNLKHKSAQLPNSGLDIKIEDVCAGKGLPQIYHLFLQELIAAGKHELNLLESYFNSNIVRAPILSKILETNSFSELKHVGLENQAAQEIALVTLKKVIEIAGAYCALLIFVSVANQIEEGRELVVALDSSQARHMSGYRDSLDKQLGIFNNHLASKVTYKLLEPQGTISVPLQGAANSLEDFIN